MSRQQAFPIIGIRNLRAQRNAKRDDTVTFRVPEEISAWLHDRARSMSISRSALICSVVHDYLARQTGTRTRTVYDSGAVGEMERRLNDAAVALTAAIALMAKLRRVA